jgi:MoaA/NifB/PqqE/SkfB family radical SAM enzyme
MRSGEIVSHTPIPAAAGQLDFLWLEITDQCNLTCSHCYAESGPSKPLFGTMDRSDWESIILQARESGCRQLQFIGGEPTLHPDLSGLLRFARAAGYSFIEVFTNATRLRPSLIDCFQENGVTVAASFYSHVPETHDRITNKPGSWEKTVAGLNRIVAAQLPLRIGVIEMEENAGHLAETVSFLESLGIKSIGADHLRKVGRGEQAPSPSTAERFDQLCGKCWQGKLCVTPSGEAFPCVFSRATLVGNAKTGLVPILLGEKLRDFRTAIYNYRGKHAHGDCNPDCMPFCKPSCTPECTPTCPPSCKPYCMPSCTPECNPDRRW